jgi:hypothetical protein
MFQVLENVVKQSEQKRTEYEDVTIKLRGLWDQLCEDLSLLAQKALDELVRAFLKHSIYVNACS